MALAWPLVGREAEVALIKRAMNRRDTRGVILAGGPGVGKTRLAREALALADVKTVSTSWAAATVSARAIPFGALAHLLPAQIPVRPDRSNLLRTLVATIRSTAGGERLVLAVDDAHLLDPSSGALVHHLAVSRQAFVVCTIRTGEPTPDAVSRLWEDQFAQRIEVQDLSRSETDALTERVLGAPVEGATRQRLWELTRGNPLFLKELIEQGLESGAMSQIPDIWQWHGPFVGPRLVEVVQARLARLSADELAALEVASIGEPLEAALLEAAAPRQVVESLERKGLLEESAEGDRTLIRLAHPLYAEVLRGATPPARVRSVSRDLARLLEAAGDRRREDSLRLAQWHRQAGVPDRPAVLAAAAERALRLFDHDLAERLARTAFRAGGEFRVGLTLAGAMMWQGRFTEVSSLLDQLGTDARTDAERAEAAVQRAHNYAWQLNQGDAALRVLEVALEVVSDVSARDLLSAAKASVLGRLGRIEQAKETGLAIVNRAGASSRALPYAYGAAAESLLYLGRPHDAVDLLERHLPRMVESLDETLFGPVTMGPALHRCLAAIFSGRFREATELAERGYQDAIEGGIDWWLGTWSIALGWSYLMRGVPRTGERWLREAVAHLRQLSVFGHLPIALSMLAHANALTGHVREAEEALTEADEAGQQYPLGQAYASLARPWVRMAHGELSHAISTAMEEARFLESISFRLFQAMTLHHVARLGDPASVVDPLNRLAGECQGALVSNMAQHATALVTEDPWGLERAADTFEEMGASLHAAEAIAQASSIYRAEGRPARAAATAIRARTLAAKCEGARSPALLSFDAPEILSRREKEISAMAAGGLANRAIAQRLGISVRTVDNHLHNVYGKLGVGGREELAAAFDALPDPE